MSFVMLTTVIKPVLSLFHDLLEDAEVAALSCTCRSLQNATKGYTVKSETTLSELHIRLGLYVPKLKNAKTETLTLLKQHPDIARRVTSLSFDNSFNDPLSVGDIPTSVVYLDVGYNFNQPLPEGVIPEGVTSLRIVGCCYRKGESLVLPDSMVVVVAILGGCWPETRYTPSEFIAYINRPPQARLIRWGRGVRLEPRAFDHAEFSRTIRADLPWTEYTYGEQEEGVPTLARMDR